MGIFSPTERGTPMNRSIDNQAYLAYARNLTEREVGFVAEFQSWLPGVIIDCHAHCNLPEHVRWVDDQDYNHMLSTFPSFSLEESKEWNGLFHPSVEVRALRFPNVFRGIDHKKANSYLLEQSPEQDRVALYGLPDDVEYTIAALDRPRVSALKMYHAYCSPAAKEIYQYFPKDILAAAQSRDIPIILHPPTRITTCIEQILRVVEDFPRLRVCIAHLSLTKSVEPGLEAAFTALAKCRRISFDTALVPSAKLVEMALRIVGVDRIMFGSDAPLGLIRSTVYQHPHLGERLVTEYQYHWVNSAEHAEFRTLACGTFHAHWQALCAVKEAVLSFPKEEREAIKQMLFYGNAKSFYGF